MTISREQIVSELKKIVDPERVITDDKVLKENSHDRFRKFESIFGVYTLPIPAAVVKVHSSAAVLVLRAVVGGGCKSVFCCCICCFCCKPVSVPILISSEILSENCFWLSEDATFDPKKVFFQ